MQKIARLVNKNAVLCRLSSESNSETTYLSIVYKGSLHVNRCLYSINTILCVLVVQYWACPHCVTADFPAQCSSWPQLVLWLLHSSSTGVAVQYGREGCRLSVKPNGLLSGLTALHWDRNNTSTVTIRLTAVWHGRHLLWAFYHSIFGCCFLQVSFVFDKWIENTPPYPPTKVHHPPPYFC